MKAKNKMIKEKPIRLDFNTESRKIIEVYEISPDGSKVRINTGWVLSYRDNVIIMRSDRSKEYLDDSQIAQAVQSERDILADKKNKDRGEYLIAKQYPIKEWLEK